MIYKTHTGRINDECYSVLWKNDGGNYEITGIQDNERNIFYDLRRTNDIIEFVRMLNLKEEVRHNTYKRITESFEKELKYVEDRNIELWEKLDECTENKNKNTNRDSVPLGL